MRKDLCAATSLLAFAIVPCHAQVTGGGATPTGDVAAQGTTTPTTVPGSSGPAAATVEDIVVTAQKRRENLQDVPVAITAMSAGRLAASSITNIADIGAVTPNLTLTDTAGTVQPHIRGVGTNFSGPGVENPVAVYVDGVYIASGTSSLLTLNNIEQVEVLKGPQGTLFGRNTTGGLIQVTTKDPAHTASAAIDLSYANYDTGTANAYLTSGLTDTLAADLAVRFEAQGEGWGRNLYNGHDVDRTFHDLAIRSKWLWEPTGGTTVRLTFDYADRKSNDSQVWDHGYPLTFNNVFFGGPYDQGGDYDVNDDVDDDSHLRSGGVSLQVNQKIGAVAFQSITAYRRTQYDFDLDLDQTPADLIGCCGPVSEQQLSQEFQLSSSGHGRLTWVGGVYLFAAKDAYQGVDITLDGPVSPAPGASFDDHLDDAVRTHSVAVYGQAGYEVLPRTTLTLGGRYTYEDRHVSGAESLFANGATVAVLPLPLPGSGFPGTITFNKFNYRVALDHKFGDDVLGYVSYNTGFKSGGYNLNSSANAPYKPEEIKAVEAGVKTKMFERRVRLNVAAFHYEYTNLQVANFTGGTTLVENGARAEIYGLDLDTDLALGHGISLTGGLGYVHDRFTSYPDAPFFPGFGGCTAAPGGFCDQSAKGNKLGQSPTWTWEAGANYKTDLSSGTLNLNLLYSYSSRWYASADNYAFQPAYGLLNASAQWTLPNDRYSLRLWGKNLTDRVYATGIGEANQGVFRYLGAPRTYGVTLGAKF